MNSIEWNELITPDPEAAAKFYGGLFGWTTETMPMPGKPYTMLKHGERFFGGLLSPTPPGLPPPWLPSVPPGKVHDPLDTAVGPGPRVAAGPEAGRGPAAPVALGTCPG